MKKEHGRGELLEDEKYGTIIFEEDGLVCLNLSKQFSLFENTNEDGTEAEGIYIDTVGAGAELSYTDLPKVIEYLQLIHQKRVVDNNRLLRRCHTCGQLWRA